MPLTTFARSIGFASGAFAAFDNTGANTQNETGSRAFTLPFSGRLAAIAAYFAGSGVAVTARCVAWRNSDGAIVSKSPKFSAPSGSLATGGQALNSQQSDGLQVIQPSNDPVWIGFWRDPAASGVWSVLGSGSFEVKTDLSGDAGAFNANTACGAPFACGDPQATVDLIGGDHHSMLAGFVCMRKKR